MDDAVTALSRMMHRGAIAADGKTGDGSGLLLSIPRKFFAKGGSEEWNYFTELYAVVDIFWMMMRIEGNLQRCVTLLISEVCFERKCSHSNKPGVGGEKRFGVFSQIGPSLLFQSFRG